jgi:multidrug efflux system membrane fusion protein
MKPLLLRSFVAVLAALSLVPAAHAADGAVAWAQRVELGVPVSGVVESVSVQAGDRVKKGQMLMELEQTPFISELERARARRTEAGTGQRLANRNLKQSKELYDRGLNSTDELEDAQLQKRRADAAVLAARARVRRAEYDLQHSAIRAPFDGWVLRRQVEPGQSIISTQQSQVLLVLAAAGRYVAQVRVEGKTIAGLEVGGTARVKVGGHSYDGKIRSVGLEPLGDTAGVLYPVSVEFNSGDMRLYAGQKASVSF